jgi:hypothetical protein
MLPYVTLAAGFAVAAHRLCDLLDLGTRRKTVRAPVLDRSSSVGRGQIRPRPISNPA